MQNKLHAYIPILSEKAAAILPHIKDLQQPLTITIRDFDL
jgi:hypothetical protein